MDAGKGSFIIVIGCGRLGSYLADQLSGAGAGVVVVDREERAFTSLSGEFGGFKIEGDATEFAVLKQARIEKADAVIGATHDDNVNMMIAQVARKVFQVPRAIARVQEPRRVDLCRALAIDSICPTAIAGDLVLRVLEKASTGGQDGGRP
jgi:trk system potassium uptake protein TrkA